MPVWKYLRGLPKKNRIETDYPEIMIVLEIVTTIQYFLA